MTSQSWPRPNRRPCRAAAARRRPHHPQPAPPAAAPRSHLALGRRARPSLRPRPCATDARDLTRTHTPTSHHGAPGERQARRSATHSPRPRQTKISTDGRRAALPPPRIAEASKQNLQDFRRDTLGKNSDLHTSGFADEIKQMILDGVEGGDAVQPRPVAGEDSGFERRLHQPVRAIPGRPAPRRTRLLLRIITPPTQPSGWP
jgi:hypothetical protein